MTAVKAKAKKEKKSGKIDALHLKAFRLMCVAKSKATIYDENKEICSKYVHSTSRGHEAIQIATAFHLKSYD